MWTLAAASGKAAAPVAVLRRGVWHCCGHARGWTRIVVATAAVAHAVAYESCVAGGYIGGCWRNASCFTSRSEWAVWHLGRPPQTAWRTVCSSRTAEPHADCRAGAAPSGVRSQARDAVLGTLRGAGARLPLQRIRATRARACSQTSQHGKPLASTFVHRRAGQHRNVDTLGVEPRAFRMRSGCDTTLKPSISLGPNTD